MRQMSPRKWVGWVLGLLCSLVAYAFSSDMPICPARPIKFALYDSPAVYDEKSGTGIDVDVLAELKKRSGCAFEKVILPRARIWAWIESGEVDMTSSGIPTPARQQFAFFSTVFVQKMMAIYSPAASGPISSFEDLRNNKALNIGAERALKHSPSIDAFLDEFRAKYPNRISEAMDTSHLLQMLQARRVDVMFAQQLAVAEFRKRGGSEFQSVDLAPNEPWTVAAVVLSKATFSETEAAKWRGLIDEMHRDGTMKAILSKYAAAKDVESMLRF